MSATSESVRTVGGERLGKQIKRAAPREDMEVEGGRQAILHRDLELKKLVALLPMKLLRNSQDMKYKLDKMRGWIKDEDRIRGWIKDRRT